jgi:hypothetical protein
MSYAQLITELRDALAVYRSALEKLPEIERDDFNRVAWHAERVATALESGALADAKLSLYAFSRQVSDSYYQQPSEFKILDEKIIAVEKTIT